MKLLREVFQQFLVSNIKILYLHYYYYYYDCDVMSETYNDPLIINNILSKGLLRSLLYRLIFKLSGNT